METITSSSVNATPRSNTFTYFTSGGGYSTKTTVTQEIPPQNDGTIIMIDELPDVSEAQQGVMYVLPDKCYVFDGAAFQIISSNTKIIAGDNITVSPPEGVGDVTISSASAPVTKIIAGDNITLNPSNGLGDVTINAANAPVTSIIAGDGIIITPSNGLGDVTVSIDEDWLTDFVTALIPE